MNIVTEANISGKPVTRAAVKSAPVKMLRWFIIVGWRCVCWSARRRLSRSSAPT
jgi:hypothetical protein